MEFFKKKTNIRFMDGRRWSYTVSGILIIGSLLLLVLRGLNFGIDFTGGVVIELAFPEAVEIDKVRSALDAAGYGEASVQTFGTTRDVLVRVLPEEGKDINQVSEGVLAAIRSYAPGVELRRTEAVGVAGRAASSRRRARSPRLFTFLYSCIYVALAIPVEARRSAR